MTRNALMLLAGLLATGLIAAGCGGDDDDDDGGDGGEALTKEEYLAQGNQICQEGNQELDAAAQEAFQQEPTPEQTEAFVNDSFVPSIQGQIDELREGIPEGDEDTVNGILDEAELALQDIKEDPSLIQGQGADPFAEINTQLREYGLTTCGSG